MRALFIQRCFYCSWDKNDCCSVYGSFPTIPNGPINGGIGAIEQAKYITKSIEHYQGNMKNKDNTNPWGTSKVNISFDLNPSEFPALNQGNMERKAAK